MLTDAVSRSEVVIACNPNAIPADKLNLPGPLVELCDKPNGLILVTGPTGSGKSTTLAALLDKINRERPGHILTVEDPVEFIHSHKRCLVNQREVGANALSFPDALHAGLREDPDFDCRVSAIYILVMFFPRIILPSVLIEIVFDSIVSYSFGGP